MNILVVDDDSVSRMAVANTVACLGRYPPKQVENGKLALEALQQGYAADVVITDVRMPVMDGMELLKHIRADARFAPLPVMMITAFSARDMVAEALKLGVQGFILKPITEDAILRVRGVLARFHATLIESLNDSMHRLSILPERYWTYIETLVLQGSNLLEAIGRYSQGSNTKEIAELRSALNACLAATKMLGARYLEKALLQLDTLLVAGFSANDTRLSQVLHATRLNLHWLDVYVKFHRARSAPG
ncbi:MAG: response regulator [Rhodoferax sp.]|nr:response regulator [Rhodoferax sp.]